MVVKLLNEWEGEISNFPIVHSQLFQFPNCSFLVQSIAKLLVSAEVALWIW